VSIIFFFQSSFINVFIVQQGGFLFEFYLSINMSLSHYKLFEFQIVNNNSLSQQFQDIIYKKYQYSFYMWVIISLYNISQKNSILLLKWIYNLYSKGLSFNGIFELSKCKLSPNLKTFKNYLNTTSRNYQKTLNELVTTYHPIIWIDNYSKFYRRYCLKNSGGYSGALWTAIGVKIDQNINLYRATTERVYLFPNNIGTFNETIKKELIDIINYSNLKIRERVYSEENELWTVPLSVKKEDRKKYKFLPYTLLDENISSNIGLKNVLRYICNRFFSTNKYNIVLCDTNIFWRILKRYYEKPKPLTLRSIPILGLWHPGKMIVECIWRNYLSYFIAKAYHFLYPNNNILYKPRLSHAIELFIQLYLSFKNWKSEHNFPKLRSKDVGYNKLKNIKLLFTFFLPLVIIYFYLMYNSVLILLIGIQLFYFGKNE
jgi:hypothetical protein